MTIPYISTLSGPINVLDDSQVKEGSPSFVVLVGLPGSGKSTFRKALEESNLISKGKKWMVLTHWEHTHEVIALY